MAKQPSQPAQENQPLDATANVYSEWVSKVVEYLVESQKRLVELAAEQNALIFKSIQEIDKFYRTAPNVDLANWSMGGLENLLENQRKWAESISMQSFPFMQGKKPEGEGKDVFESWTNQVQGFMDSRKRWLDFLSEENTRFMNGMFEGLSMSATPQTSNITEWAKQAIDTYVESQRRWLDMFMRLPSGGKEKA
jgi:hypothetical protein